MATQVTLADGFRLGDVLHVEVELRAPTAGDLIEAAAEAERPVLTQDGWQLLLSASLAGHHVLRRQIVRIGTHPGPLLLAELKRLSARDLAALQRQAEILDQAVLQAVHDRGRGSAPGSSVGGP